MTGTSEAIASSAAIPNDSCSEGSEGQATGFQSQNTNGVANPADTDSTLQNELTNSQGIYLELYEERIWEANRQTNGVIDPAGSGRTMAQWADQLNSRRRTLFANIPDPYPATYRHTFTRTLPPSAGNQTFYYVHGAKCGVGNATPGSIVIAPGTASPPRHRAARH